MESFDHILLCEHRNEPKFGQLIDLKNLDNFRLWPPVQIPLFRGSRGVFAVWTLIFQICISALLGFGVRWHPCTSPAGWWTVGGSLLSHSRACVRGLVFVGFPQA